MKKYIIIVIALLAGALIIAGIYLNRAYAHIYSKFDKQPWPEKIVMETVKKQNKLVYVALGDSLTYGIGAENTAESFPAVLSNKLSSATTSVELVNLGIPGAVSHNVIYNELSSALAAKPDFVTLLIGVNDMHNFIGIDAYKNNLRTVLARLKMKTKAEIVVISVPNLGVKNLLLPPYDSIFAQKTDEYNEALKSVCRDAKVRFIDISKATSEWRGDPSYYAADGFHPSAKGYESWANTIYVQLK